MAKNKIHPFIEILSPFWLMKLDSIGSIAEIFQYVSTFDKSVRILTMLNKKTNKISKEWALRLSWLFKRRAMISNILLSKCTNNLFKSWQIFYQLFTIADMVLVNIEEYDTLIDFIKHSEKPSMLTFRSIRWWLCSDDKYKDFGKPFQFKNKNWLYGRAAKYMELYETITQNDIDTSWLKAALLVNDSIFNANSFKFVHTLKFNIREKSDIEILKKSRKMQIYNFSKAAWFN